MTGSRLIKPAELLARDLVEASAHLNDQADALSDEDAHRLADALLEVGRGDLFLAYLDGQTTNLAYLLPCNVTLSDLADALGCDLARARIVMAGEAWLSAHEVDALRTRFGVDPSRLRTRRIAR